MLDWLTQSRRFIRHLTLQINVVLYIILRHVAVDPSPKQEASSPLPPQTPLSALAAMADALVSIVLEKLIDVRGQQLPLSFGTTHELGRLMGTFRSIHAFLRDAESRQFADRRVRLWLSGLRRVSYDIEDLLDEWEISGGLGEEGDEDGGNRRNKVYACLFSRYNCFDRVVSRYNAARRIKEIRQRLDKIADNENTDNFISCITQGGDHIMLVRNQRLRSLFMEESEMMIGRENAKEIMISRLVCGSSSHEEVGGQVHVVAVVGFGELGKTTLARQIYLDGKVRANFSMFLWVCVSDVFDVIRLTKEILEQVKGTRTCLWNLASLQNELVKSLRGKSFLLVLDDVWNDDAEKWEMLRLPLKCGAHGSRILVTTHSQKVAYNMNATYIHELEGLSDDYSWELFSSRAFAGRKAVEYSKLESLGREIVNKCKGVPLSIMLIGSAMYSKRNVEDWESILDSKIWSLPQFSDKFPQALLLAYLNLPTPLKKCFSYCSMFPKDWEFKKDMLVQIWVAQGFIHPQRNREIEDIGGEYFDVLVGWSILQQVEKDGETRYTIHGLLHDLGKFIAKDEIYTFSSEGGEPEQRLSSTIRHLFLSFTDNDGKHSNIPVAAHRAKKLRTLWLHGIDGSGHVIVDILHQAKSLRALSFMGSKYSEKIVKLPVKLLDIIGKMWHLRYLDLSGSDIVELPDAIGKMRNLRYLDLSGSDIVELPESVSHLPNLHTLNLTGCVKLKRLPGGMGGMVSLRHLEIERTDSLECLPKGLGRIRGLRSLCKFIVGVGEGGCQIDELRRLNSLQGILRIQYLERVSGPEEAEKAELWNKLHLRRLVLSMSGESVIECLRPHSDLEELKLFWYTGSKLPSWMELMQRLHKLELCGCPKLEGLLHHVEGISLIRELMIRDCPRIKGIAGSSSFVFLEKISAIDSNEFFSSGLPPLPNLKTFEIRGFMNETLPEGGWEQLVALQTLEIWNCSELKCLPEGSMQLQSLENLIIFGCDKLEWLPQRLGQLKKLKALTIGVLKVVTSLPDSLQQLKLLEHLEVSSCKKLESLPHGLQHLCLLRRLLICGCPLLSERCKREGGVDWHKISHIPNIEIDKEWIQ